MVSLLKFLSAHDCLLCHCAHLLLHVGDSRRVVISVTARKYIHLPRVPLHHVFVRQYLPFLAQYHHCITLWAPACTAFTYVSGEGVHVVQRLPGDFVALVRRAKGQMPPSSPTPTNSQVASASAPSSSPISPSSSASSPSAAQKKKQKVMALAPFEEYENELRPGPETISQGDSSYKHTCWSPL